MHIYIYIHICIEDSGFGAHVAIMGYLRFGAKY